MIPFGRRGAPLPGPLKSMTKGDLFIVSAPSGAGKSTILRSVLSRMDGIAFSISHTTRPMRAGEQEGVDYFFVSQERFQEMVRQDAFLEWAEVHGNFYGTSKGFVEEVRSSGRDVVLDIDVQGAFQVKEKVPDAVLVFVLPPSMEELERRLRHRGTEDDSTISLRLANARAELEAVSRYDFIVVNDELERAVQGMEAIILSRRLSARRMLPILPEEFR